jgi:hypothetical protein
MLVCGLSFLVSACGGSKKTRTEVRETGYRGIAQSQPYLALERTLTKLDYETKTLNSLSELNHYGTLVLSGDGSVGQNTALQALTWVQSPSKHLILILRGCEPWRNDWATGFSDLFEDSSLLEINPIIKELGIKINDASLSSLFKPTSTETISIRKKSYEQESAKALSINTTESTYPFDVLSSTDQASSIVSTTLPSGGRITVVADGIPFRNRYLGEKDHGAIFVALLELQQNDHFNFGNPLVHFLLRGNESFFSLLWKQFWPVIIALLALIIAWLWKNLPRFGPLRILPDHQQRQFTEHLKLTGNFLWRRKQVADLFLPLRRTIQRKLHAKHGFPIEANSEDGHLLERLTHLSGLPYDRVAVAWQTNHVKDAPRFLRIISDLQLIEQSL